MNRYKRIENKELWPDGPWKNEPDNKDFVYRDIKCYIKRGPLGHLNGYACFPLNIDIDRNEIDIHGGITFDAQNEHGNIIGFDCSHHLDITPIGILLAEKINKDNKDIFYPDYSFYKKMREKNSSYKDIEYVENEIKSLVDQVLNKE